MHEDNSGSNFLSNPYVLIGGALIVYWYLSRRKILKGNPNADKSLSFIEKNSLSKIQVDATAKKYRVPKKLVKDVQQMKKKDLAQMIIDNQNMLNKTKMSNDERNHVLRMVDYLEVELDKRM